MRKQFYFEQFSLAEVHSFIVKTVLFRAILFSISTQFSSIWAIDRSLSGATTPGQSGPWNDGNKRVLCIPQSSSITGPSLTHFLGHMQDTPKGCLTHLLRCCRFSLQSQLTLNNQQLLICHKTKPNRSLRCLSSTCNSLRFGDPPPPLHFMLCNG